MTDPEAVALSVQGPDSLRGRFYGALARAIESSRSAAIAVFVSAGGSPTRWAIVRPRAVVDVTRSEPAVARAAAPWSGPVPSFLPPSGTAGRLAAAVPCPRTGVPRRSGEPVDAPSIGSLLGTDGWVGVQTIWTGGGGRGLWAARRWWFAARASDSLDARFEAVSTGLAAAWGEATGTPARPQRLGWWADRDWTRLAVRTIPRAAWAPVGPDRIRATPEADGAPPLSLDPPRDGPAIVLGATGAGKSWFLADRAAGAIARGEALVAIDLHGDLAPSIVARLPLSARSRTVCVDLTDGPVPGIAALAPTESPERAAAHLVAALKRLSPDGAEIYWGFRLERIFDAFVRLVQESGGSLLDLAALLGDADLRDAARLATRRPDLARFLEELGPIVRRNPDFLWAAAARLAKVVGVPRIGELLAPRDGGIPVAELLGGGRSILVRIPFAEIGPEAASFAATLVLARVYLEAAAARSAGRDRPPITVVLDEVQGFSPRLVAEMLAEGRKFGFRLLLATQFPERLAPELRSTVQGVVRDVIAFRVPRPSAPSTGRWLGLAAADAEQWLADLPPGHGLARGPDHPHVRPIAPGASPPPIGADHWSARVRATRAEFGVDAGGASAGPDLDAATERILLAALSADERGETLAAGALVDTAGALPGPPIDRALLADRVAPLERQGYLVRDGTGVRLTSAGERRLGLGTPTGATRESDAHRGLLLAAFRLFARRGHRLEIVRQGRFDTRLPDAYYRQIPEALRAGPPGALSAALDRIRTGWAWRFFGGQDVHVEAEVSGALRPARIRHGAAKARSRGAFALFLVTDAHRATRVRSTLRALGLGPDRAQVWTLAPFGPATGEGAAATRADPIPGPGTPGAEGGA